MGGSNGEKLLAITVRILIVWPLCVLWEVVLFVGVRYGVIWSPVLVCWSSSLTLIIVTPSATSAASGIALDRSTVASERCEVAI